MEKLARVFASSFEKIAQHQNETALAIARQTVPFETILDKSLNEFGGSTEGTVRVLLDWFKNSFFKWVDSPPCSVCSNEKTSAVGTTGPTNKEEVEGQAFNVEIYQCPKCSSITRFPRFNSCITLLNSRRGRCGEWANAFTLIVQSIGIEARYVIDLEDHVWTEVWIPKSEGDPDDGSWVHVDACENAFDSPLMYQQGWGKTASYVFAFGRFGVRDVTRRYCLSFEAIKPKRNLVSEDWLRSLIVDYNKKLFSSLNEKERKLAIKHAACELQEWERNKERRKVSEEESKGRISGSKEWREARGETGKPGIDWPHSEIAAITQPILVNDFSQKDIFVCNGSAQISSERLIITPNRNDCRGSCWLKQKIDVSKSFKVSFVFQCGSDKGDGADGFSFCLQDFNENALGNGGCHLGYGGLVNSVALEFDCYKSFDTCEDPDGSHISLQTRGKDPNSSHHRYSLACASLSKLNNGRERKVCIVYKRKKIFVMVDEEPVLEKDFDIGTIVRTNSNSYWCGFTGSTGGLCQSHEILRFSLHTD